MMASFIARLNGDKVLNTPANDLIDAVLAQYLVNSPELQMDGKYSPGAKDVQIDITGDYRRLTRGPGPHYVQGTEFAMHVPFEGEEEILYLRPHTFWWRPTSGVNDRGRRLLVGDVTRRL